MPDTLCHKVPMTAPSSDYSFWRQQVELPRALSVPTALIPSLKNFNGNSYPIPYTLSVQTDVDLGLYPSVAIGLLWLAVVPWTMWSLNLWQQQCDESNLRNSRLLQSAGCLTGYVIPVLGTHMRQCKANYCRLNIWSGCVGSWQWSWLG